mmetsp:Transcript_24463/g.44245  ORF Transcript_24463/g.44245 Transcript_24463/m.44245 type:complete len:81 (+) Transcript_24463:322-564(+)
MRGFNEYSGNFLTTPQSWLGSRERSSETIRRRGRRVSNGDVILQRTLIIGTCKHCSASLFLFLVAFDHNHNEQRTLCASR